MKKDYLGNESKDVVNRSIMALFLPFLTMYKNDKVIHSYAVFSFLIVHKYF